MNTHLIALWLMAAQGCIGAFDTLFHHELTVALPRQETAHRELSIHAIRAIIYSVLFIGLSYWTWNGLLAVALFIIFAIEIILTLWDFVVEDRTRLLPATERVVHTILAINGGAFIALLALNIQDWAHRPTGFGWEPYGYLSLFLALCGVGVGISGVRDALASHHLKHRLSGLRGQYFNRGASPQKFLLTGATGFVGTYLVSALLASGHEVTIITRRPRQAAWKFSGLVRCVSALSDLHHDTSFDIVINLAGAPILGPRWTAKRRATLLESRIGTTKKLVDWLATATAKPRLLLSASAIGYYGIQPLGNDAALNESASPQSIFMSELGQRWEEAAYAARKFGVTVVAMRFGLIFGRKGALPLMLLPIRLGLGGRLGSGKQWISWIHIEDVIGAIAYLCGISEQDNLPTAFNLTAPEAVQQKDFAKIAGQILHRPSFLPTPAAPMRLMLGEQSDLLLQGQRVVPDHLLQRGFVFQHPKLREALQDLA